jgi:hypothetical protein
MWKSIIKKLFLLCQAGIFSVTGDVNHIKALKR